ncbi:MAG: trypsin-like serine protease, partial [Planctomycetaceae bacterium]|nr:trypsin-like serine protease [Planctomycetaceae bacterium]
MGGSKRNRRQFTVETLEPRRLLVVFAGREFPNGTDSDFEAVGRINGSDGNYGSGTLIAPNWLVTAAHVIDVPNATYTVRFAGQSKSYNVVERRVLEGWLTNNDTQYDIGLIRLSESVSGITPLKLTNQQIKPGDILPVLGWGKSEYGASHINQPQGGGILRNGTIQIDAVTPQTNTMVSVFKQKPSPRAYQESATAPGDSGGALLTRRDISAGGGPGYRIAGIVSSGEEPVIFNKKQYFSIINSNTKGFVDLRGGGSLRLSQIPELRGFISEVLDSTPPELRVPAQIMAVQNLPFGSRVEVPFELLDNIDPSPAIEFSPSLNSVFPVGETVVNVAARDSSGNVTTAQVRINVSPNPEVTGFSLPQQIPAGRPQRKNAVGDVNGDGYPDIVTAAFEGISLLLNQTNREFSLPIPVSTVNTYDVHLVDLNNDGKLDILSRVFPDSFQCSAYLGYGTGGFTLGSTCTLGEIFSVGEAT